MTLSLHLEVFGITLHVDLGHTTPSEAPPDNAPQPMVVYPDPDTVGFRLAEL